jgi:hypothetical protein
MPCGLVRSDLNLTGITFKDGFPLVLPANYEAENEPSFPGNVVDWLPSPAHFGNPVPPTDLSFNSNVVLWTVNPAQFGNIIGQPEFGILLLVDNTAVLLVDDTDILLVS